MSRPELDWLLAVLVQVFGCAVMLASLSFTYEASLREKKTFFLSLQAGARSAWLAAGSIVLAVGVGISNSNWLIKGTAILLAMLLVCFAGVSTRRRWLARPPNPHPKPTFVSVGLTLLKIWLAIFLLLVAVWAAHLGWHAYHLYSLARDLPRNVDQLQVDSLLPMIGNAAQDVHTLHENLQPLYPLFNAMHNLPRAGPYLGQIEPLLTYADGLAQAGNHILTALQPLLVPPGAQQSALPLPERVSLVLEAGQAHFTAAALGIAQAGTARSHIDPALLPGSVSALFTNLDERFIMLEAGSQFLLVAPGLLGADQPTTYLILAQNRDELRATGGFITGIGLVTLDKGKIQQFSLGDSYTVDDFTKPYPVPPDALHRFMLADYWVPRDANWSPDFPTSARQAQALFTLSTGVETQGVIAFNQLAVRSILQALGPLNVPGTTEPVTAENVEAYMRQAWAPQPEEGLSQEWWLHRKDFMQLLGNALIEKALSANQQDQLISLAKVMIDLLDRGQLLVFFNNQAAQAALQKSGWDGGVHPGNGDYLSLVDSNVGFNKVDSVISRSISYQVDLRDPAHPTGAVTLSYQNTASGDVPCVQVASYGNGTYQDMQQRCYWDYWRLYTPAGAGLVSSTVLPVPASQLLDKKEWPGQLESMAGEAGTQVFAGLFVLPLSKALQVEIRYTLPQPVVYHSSAGQNTYSLRVAVQPGLQGLPFKLEITLPANTEILSASDGLTMQAAGTWLWQGVLEQTTDLTLAYR